MNKGNIYISDHPLIKHKICYYEDIKTGTNEFRTLADEIAVLLGFEALKDLQLEERKINTPICSMNAPFISGKKLAIVPILRAVKGWLMVF